MSSLFFSFGLVHAVHYLPLRRGQDTGRHDPQPTLGQRKGQSAAPVLRRHTDLAGIFGAQLPELLLHSGGVGVDLRMGLLLVPDDDRLSFQPGELHGVTSPAYRPACREGN